MEPESVSAPLGAFFEPVRRRHPEVDIVVLPGDPDASAGRPQPSPLDDVQIGELRERVSRLAAGWWARVAGDCQKPTAARIGYGSVEGSVVVVCRRTLHAGAGPDSLATLASAVQGDGGTVHESPHHPDRVVGHLGDLRVRASYRPSRGLVLEVESGPIQVGHQRARELARR